jgi:hypothetical protein
VVPWAFLATTTAPTAAGASANNSSATFMGGSACRGIVLAP